MAQAATQVEAKVVEVAGAFGEAHLRVASRVVPAPGPGEVRLAMRAASLNYRDLMMIRGQYNPRQPLPLVPCSDGVGVVEAVGVGVDRVAVGDRVCPIFSQGWLDGAPSKGPHATTLGGPLDGALASHMVVSQEGVVHVPEHLSDAEAATLPCAGVTAWRAVVELAQVKPGDVVLMQGTGGVSMFALQLALAAGARTIITSSSDEKLARARELGAHETINYRQTPAWGKAARALTGGEGVDVVVEVGGADTLAESMRAVRMGGTLCVIGVLSGGQSPTSLIPILMNQLRAQGVFVGPRSSFEAMNRAIAHHQLRPVLDARRFTLDEAPEAFGYMASGGHFGKITLTI